MLGGIQDANTTRLRNVCGSSGKIIFLGVSRQAFSVNFNFGNAVTWHLKFIDFETC